MMAAHFRFKKDLKAMVGKVIRPFLEETSIFGQEYYDDLNGVPVVGPGPYERRWFAQIWVRDGILVKVK